MKRWSAVIAMATVVALVGLAASFSTAQTAGDAAKGQAVYKAKCASCHGAGGAGDSPAGQKLKAKDWTKGDGLKDLNDQQLFDSIKKGGPAVGRAKTMIAFPTMSDADIWNVVAYIKTLAKS
jgi:mono/diheme cytochrome c family protein